jgi:hypothetical protein
MVQPHICGDLKQRHHGPGFWIQASKDQAPNSSIYNGTRAHRARLLGHIQRALDMPRPELRGRLTERDDLSMRCGVTIQFTAIVRRGDQLIPNHHHRPHGYIPERGRAMRLCQRNSHPSFIIGRLCLAGIRVKGFLSGASRVTRCDRTIDEWRRLHGGSERGRTSNPRFRRPVLYPLSYGSKNDAKSYCNLAGGERGIRTLGTGKPPYAGLANRCLQPLGHLSKMPVDASIRKKI